MFIEKGIVKVEQDTAWKVSKYRPEKNSLFGLWISEKILHYHFELHFALFKRIFTVIK